MDCAVTQSIEELLGGVGGWGMGGGEVEEPAVISMSQSYTSMRDYAPSSSNTNSHFQISVYSETEEEKKNISKTVMFTQPSL